MNLRTCVRTDDGHWEFAFGVQNVTNQSYGVAGFDVPIVNGFAIINGPPRTFLGTIRYRF